MIEERNDDSTAMIDPVELTNELDDSLSSPLHQILKGQLVIHVNNHRFPIVLICHTLDVGANLVQRLVVARRMEEKPGLVALG